jgi:two-component system, cell cycle response regulator
VTGVIRSVRFRHKLSIVLVGLALVPLVGAGLIVQALLIRNETSKVDSKLASGAAAASASYRAQLAGAQSVAMQLASRPDVARAFRRRDGSDLNLAEVPAGYVVALADAKGMFAGSEPAGPAWQARAELVPITGDRRVIVFVPLDDSLVSRIAEAGPIPEGVDVSLVMDGTAVGAPGGAAGPVDGVSKSDPVDGRIGDQRVRAEAIGVEGPAGTQLVASYPLPRLDDRIDSIRLRVLLPMAILAGLVATIALFAADRISRVITDLSGRALALVDASAEPVARGDEFDELNSALDTMSTELTSRRTELEGERARLKTTLARYGETLAATHDQRALLEAVLDTAVQATRARGGRLLLYDATNGEASEEVRMGTARGSRADLPMVVTAGAGIEGEALATGRPQVATAPRAVLVVPIHREKTLLGVITVVDPEDGSFGSDDVETLAGLAAQTGVAVENVRLHLVVKKQAVTDELTGLANRRQFYEVLGREFERSQRFSTPLSLIMFDIDDFKRVNDTHPMKHLAGDAALRSVADEIAGLTRDIDLDARHGGEEFAILLPQTDLAGGVQLAERLREAIEVRQIPFGDQPISVTASFGVACMPEDTTTLIDLISAAENRMYNSKRNGKNRVTPSPDGD